MRQEVARFVHHLDASLAVRDPDVHVQTENEQLADDVLQLVLKYFVALGLGDLLVLPMREGVRARGGDPEADRLKERRERAPQGRDLRARFADIGADLRARLDDRLHHLRLDLLAQARTRGREERLTVALELPFGINDLELLLDPDGQARDVGLPHRCRAAIRASLMVRYTASASTRPRKAGAGEPP